MGSKIKGGGRAIMSEESREALIDLLISIDRENSPGSDLPDIADLSLHDKKRTRKRFTKKLVRRYERGQLRKRHGASSSQQKEQATAQNLSASNESSSGGTNPNVRIELAEAVFAKEKDRKKTSKDDNVKSKKKKGLDDAFKIGTKKVIVVSRSTSINELLKLSQAKLKLKRPVCAFLQPSSSMLFELKTDLETINDGTIVYVSVTHLPADKESSDDEVDNDDEEKDSIDPLESVKLSYERQEMSRRQQTCTRVDEIIDESKREEYAKIRSRLPAAELRQQIIDTISNNSVVILSGTTGSGKSTQVPQFLLESSLEQQDRKRPYIVVTQPRRVAAISLAHRVASERGCPPPGSKGSSVGYTVRLDNQVDLRSCRIVYMTIGILLRMLVKHQPEQETCIVDENIAPSISIDSMSHLIIDEVHERDVYTDFALTMLKGMMSSKPSLTMPRLILMSATTSAELFVNYFTIPGNLTPVTIEIPGRTFPVDIKWLIDCEKFTGKRLMLRRQGNCHELARSNSGKSKCNDIVLSPRVKDRIDNEFIRSLVIKIMEQQQDGSIGAILVFLPGLSEINALNRCLSEGGYITGDTNICALLTLHSSTSKSDQARVFQPSLKTKIILSTNIAETVSCPCTLRLLRLLSSLKEYL
jgi:HrpA-like RNA helicase